MRMTAIILVGNRAGAIGVGGACLHVAILILHLDQLSYACTFLDELRPQGLVFGFHMTLISNFLRH